jgi:hypothetical protein
MAGTAAVPIRAIVGNGEASVLFENAPALSANAIQQIGTTCRAMAPLNQGPGIP